MRVPKEPGNFRVILSLVSRLKVEEASVANGGTIMAGQFKAEGLVSRITVWQGFRVMLKEAGG
ncbi:hypothetical protein GCM10009122_12590 [Fulvivirga kasyanovii]